MDFRWPDAYLAFRDEVEAFIHEWRTPELSAEMREEQFRILLAESFDFPAIGRFVLGPYWRQASDSEQQNFLAVFQDAMVQRFLPMFENYGN